MKDSKWKFLQFFLFFGLSFSNVLAADSAKPGVLKLSVLPIQMATIPPKAKVTSSPTPTTHTTAIPSIATPAIVIPTVAPIAPIVPPQAEQTSESTQKIDRKSPRINFKINLNLTRGSANTAVKTSVNLVKGESVVIGGLLRTLCKQEVCKEKDSKHCPPQKCEELHEDIKLTLTEFKNEIVHCRFDVIGPQPADHIGFTVSGKIYTTISYNLQGELRTKLLLTPSLL